MKIFLTKNPIKIGWPPFLIGPEPCQLVGQDMTGMLVNTEYKDESFTKSQENWMYKLL